jgi:hypothetical protein
MALSELDSRIQANIESFVEDISTLVKRSAINAVAEALGNGSTPRRAGGRRAAGVQKPAGVTPRRKGAKRDPGELEALTKKLGDFIRATPGQRIEEIGSALGVKTKELALPAKKLIAAREVSTRGRRRATTYFPR